MRTPLLTLALVLSATTGVAGAQSLSAAKSLFDQGKWQDAASMAAALNTSDGLAASAEYTTAGAGISAADDKKALFQKAQDYAKRAIGLNANNAEAYFEMARAQGRLAQFAGVFESLGLAKEMKRNLDRAIELNPKLAGAYVALGLWNATLDSGGVKGAIAKSQTGADKRKVNDYFKKAISLEPNNPTHRIEWVNALQTMNVMNQGSNKKFAIDQLTAALSMPATTFWDKRQAAEARATLDKLK